MKTRVVRSSAIAACPHKIIATVHYRDDASCRCDDPTHVEMSEWGYRWEGDAKKWVAPRLIPIAMIDADPAESPLAEEAVDVLATSIQVDGVREPISVVRKRDGRYSVVYGTLRVAACEVLGIEEILAFVYEAPHAG